MNRIMKMYKNTYTNLCITVECRMHIEVHENENKHVSVHAQCKCWYGGCGR